MYDYDFWQPGFWADGFWQSGFWPEKSSVTVSISDPKGGGIAAAEFYERDLRKRREEREKLKAEENNFLEMLAYLFGSGVLN